MTYIYKLPLFYIYVLFFAVFDNCPCGLQIACISPYDGDHPKSVVNVTPSCMIPLSAVILIEWVRVAGRGWGWTLC